MKVGLEEGSTPIDESERADLIPHGVASQAELNRLEERNIAEAAIKVFGRRRKDWLSIKYMRELHKKMFGQVWKWAGRFRTSNKNLGVDKSQIQTELAKLCDDVRYWIDHQTYGWDEIAVRFHHRLVAIHPFANGNGRHARMMADILLDQNGVRRLSWGRTSLLPSGETRAQYIQALKKGDQGEIEELLRFAIS